MITVDFGDGLIVEMPESCAKRVDGEIENDIEHTTWTEYWKGGRIIHRSVHVRLKTWPTAESATGRIG